MWITNYNSELLASENIAERENIKHYDPKHQPEQHEPDWSLSREECIEQEKKDFGVGFSYGGEAPVLTP